MEKKDGSLMILYYAEGAWRVATSGQADAGQKSNKQTIAGNGAVVPSFYALFWDIWNKLALQLPNSTDTYVVVNFIIYLHSSFTLNQHFDFIYAHLPIFAKKGVTCLN